MHWELHDADLVLLISRERRGSQVALWSLAAVFLVPGSLDGSIALVALGASIAVRASVVSVRAFRRRDAAVLRLAPPASERCVPGTAPSRRGSDRARCGTPRPRRPRPAALRTCHRARR